MLNTTEFRRAELEKSYYFLCECEKCMTDELYVTAGLCAKCNDAINVNEDKCKKCLTDISLDHQDKFIEVTNETARHLESMSSMACILCIYI